MITRGGLLALLFVGGLVLVTVNVAQTEKSRLVTTGTPGSAQIISVDNSTACVDTDDKAALTNGTVSDTVEWKIASNHVTNFHIIFPKKSPSQHNERYFDKNHNKFTVVKKPVNDTEVFEYVISVDLTSGGPNTCDPHVIVIKGSGDLK